MNTKKMNQYKQANTSKKKNNLTQMLSKKK